MTASPRVLYTRETSLDVAEFKQVLIESGLGASRPVSDDKRLSDMINGSNLILTARLNQPSRRLLGVARGITDFVWCCYLSELAVSASAQGLGVGRALLKEVKQQLGPSVSLILASVPQATGFYERNGMERISDAFWFRRKH
ncbi:GNAT family N-acetyltransferase [Acidisoma cellulosilyticum]|nr:GNAT family N-acetyltransferase [Acidisoma cellulosilyticum]